MPETKPAARYRFGVFEVDSSAGELRRQGLRVKLHAQPFQLLLLLLERPGEVLTREEISRELWPDGTFVDYEHGVNSALNRLRDALGDKASQPRYVETLARRGYRFVAPVERIGNMVAGEGKQILRFAQDDNVIGDGDTLHVSPPEELVAEEPKGLLDRMLAAEEDLPKSSPKLVRTLFLLMQLMYVGFYVGALANLAEIGDLIAPLPWSSQIFLGIVATAAVLIPARAFVFCGVLFGAPGMRGKYLTIWPVLLVADLVWALAPFLLLHHINYGVALACATLLVYSPFAQRSLMLMGAASQEASAAA